MRQHEWGAAGVLGAAVALLGVVTEWRPGAVLLPATLAALVVLVRVLPQREEAPVPVRVKAR